MGPHKESLDFFFFIKSSTLSSGRVGPTGTVVIITIRETVEKMAAGNHERGAARSRKTLEVGESGKGAERRGKGLELGSWKHYEQEEFQ